MLPARSEGVNLTAEVTIDGSQGEGGGQILRSSLTLSAVSGRTLKIINIRAGRKKPGLLRQHLTCVQAAAQISGADVVGAEVGSRELTFNPGPIQSGDYHFRIGSAGSTTLVLQTVLPALFTASGTSSVTVEGGTHNMQAPPFDFLQRSWQPLVEIMGPAIALRLDRHGFFPAGGGCVVAEVTPSAVLAGFDLLDPGRIHDRHVQAVVSNLPLEIAEREMRRAVRKLSWPSDAGTVRSVPSNGPGNFVSAEVRCENVTAMFCGFGRVGVRAEQVADGVVRAVRSWLKNGAPVGPFLADQLMLPLALSAAQPVDCGVQRGGRFRTGPLTEHSRTHLEILPQFLDIHVGTQRDDSGVLVEITPPGLPVP